MTPIRTITSARTDFSGGDDGGVEIGGHGVRDG
jgi:hypothetical protein